MMSLLLLDAQVGWLQKHSRPLLGNCSFFTAGQLNDISRPSVAAFFPTHW
jgi:hypothetical protein